MPFSLPANEISLLPPLKLDNLISTMGEWQLDNERTLRLLDDSKVVAWLTDDEQQPNEDFVLLSAACAEKGVDLQQVQWNDPQIRWRRFHSLLPLGISAQQMRSSSFRHWVSERQAEQCEFIQPLPAINWNLDKGYLLEMQEAGIDMAPLQLRLAQSASAGNWPVHCTLVGRPRWGWGGHEIELLQPGAWEAPGQDMIVGEYQPQICRHGEISVLMIAGQPCGQIRRLAAEREFRVGAQQGGSMKVEPLDLAAAEAAQHIWQQLPHQPIYGMIDLWDWHQPIQLAGIQLAHPDLCLRMFPQAATLLAAQLAG